MSDLIKCDNCNCITKNPPHWVAASDEQAVSQSVMEQGEVSRLEDGGGTNNSEMNNMG